MDIIIVHVNFQYFLWVVWEVGVRGFLSWLLALYNYLKDSEAHLAKSVGHWRFTIIAAPVS